MNHCFQPAANKDALLSLASEIKASFDVAGHVTPVASLASGGAGAKEIETAYVAPVVSEAQPKAESTKVVEPEVIKEEPIPIPETEVKEEEKSVPLPSSEPVPLPKVDEPVIEVDERKDSEKTDDAFAGAFQ